MKVRCSDASRYGPEGMIQATVHSAPDETIVMMPGEDGSLTLLFEQTTAKLSRKCLRDLLFYGSPVKVVCDGGMQGLLSIDPTDRLILLAIGGDRYSIPRSVVRAVLRGRLPVAYLRSIEGRVSTTRCHRTSDTPSTPG